MPPKPEAKEIKVVLESQQLPVLLTDMMTAGMHVNTRISCVYTVFVFTYTCVCDDG